MKTFIVAFISFHYNELILTKILAYSDIDACKLFMLDNDWELSDEDIISMETIKQAAFNGDAMINAMEI